MGVVIVASGVFVTNRVNAQDLVPANETFITRVAEKLGIAQDEVVEVVDDLREDMQAQRQAERVEAVTQAIEDEKLTERQAQILDAMEDIRPAGRPEDWETWHSYTPEQRESLRDDRREAREQEMLDALNAQGLSVTEEEFTELHEIMLEEGIGMYGRRGEKGLQMGGGMGRGMGRGDGECNR